MTRPRDDPTRRCMPVRDWPERDRRAWANARAPSMDVLSSAGAAAHWRPSSCRSFENAYGRWLTFLEANGALDPTAAPGERATKDRLRAYITELKGQVAPATLAGRIRDLNIVLNLIDPNYDDTALRLVRQKLKSRARPTRNKRALMVEPEHFLRLAAELIERAEAESNLRPDWRACTYRDGVILLILVFRPQRRGNLSDLVFGQTLFDDDDRFRICFDGTRMKNGRDYTSRLPEMLTPFLRRYLDHYRPALLRGAVSDNLWISSRGHPLDDASLYGKIVKHTRNAFGKAVSPHLFRDVAVTYLGEENPELVRLASFLLHHSDPRTTESHYNHARSHHAVRDYQRVVTERRGNK